MNFADLKNHVQHAPRRTSALFSLLVGAAAFLAGNSLPAADIETTLYPSQSSSNSVVTMVPAMPPSADILFSFDCTGSMSLVLDEAKTNALSLMAALQATGVNFQYAVSSFMDYPNVYGNCGYSNYIEGYGFLPYGDAMDYPYLLSQGLTSKTNAVATAIQSLDIGSGSDGPESYTRALYESYADTNMGWRVGTKRVMVNFGDAVPHDCNINEGIPGTGSTVITTGGDPGRDGVLDTSDDLDLQTVLSEMASNHVALLAARCSSYGTDYAFTYWSNWTARTGGKAFETTSANLIRDLMKEITNSLVIKCVTNLHMVFEPPSFSSWLTAPPPAYDQICSGETATFNLPITVPAGTPAGDYAFTVRVLDGLEIEYMVQSVLIHVLPTVPLPFALNNSDLTWNTSPAGFWVGQTNVSHDGEASGTAFEQSSLRTTVTGPGTLTFWWKASSPTNLEVLNFTVGGVTNLSIAGETDWEQRLFYLPSGPKALAWSYYPSGSPSATHGWVDQIGYVSGGTAPFITKQPTDQVSFGGVPVTFTAAANGTPNLSYQWRFNGANIPGATSTSYTIARPDSSNNGGYSVRVSNTYGSTNSAVAGLVCLSLVVQGDNSFGQGRVSLVATNAMQVGAGSWHTMVLRADGSVFAWGANSDGQCDTPSGLVDVVQIAGGGYHSLALQANGKVVGWGANYNRQATPPAGLSRVMAIAAGTWHSLALKSDGTVVAWGDNSSGQTSVPAGLKNVIAIAAGGNHNLALLADHTVAAWGENTDSQGAYSGQSVVPYGLTGVKAISAGEYHSLAVRDDGTVVAWGAARDGQCNVPAGLGNVVAVVGGGAHSLALKQDGTIVGWGNNWSTQAGFSSNIVNVTTMAAGTAHSVLLVGVARPKLFSPSFVADQFGTLVPTLPGRSYALQYKTSLDSPSWNTASVTPGTGAPLLLADPSATDLFRFYRLLIW